MKLKRHADRTESLFGCRGEDIHKWVDQYFDIKRFRRSVRRGFFDRWNPYEHRKLLHHKDALPEVLNAFKNEYPPELIEKVFLQHLKDDYNGYIPLREDFEDSEFCRKYHHWF